MMKNIEKIKIMKIKFMKIGSKTIEDHFQISEKDLNIINSGLTCAFNFVEKYMNNLSVQNLTNKKTCFNAKGFDDFKDILNCGYSEINATIGGKLINFITCFYIPS